MRNQILETIKTRRSVRKYKKTQIKDDELENVLVAGTYAPTARGLQAPYIVAVQKPELKEQLIRMNAFWSSRPLMAPTPFKMAVAYWKT